MPGLCNPVKVGERLPLTPDTQSGLRENKGSQGRGPASPPRPGLTCSLWQQAQSLPPPQPPAVVINLRPLSPPGLALREKVWDPPGAALPSGEASEAEHATSLSGPSGLGRQRPHGSGPGWARPPPDGMYRGNRPAFQSPPGCGAAAAACPRTGPEAAGFPQDPHRPPKSSPPLPLIPTPVSPIRPVICVAVAWGGPYPEGLVEAGGGGSCAFLSSQPRPCPKGPGGICLPRSLLPVATAWVERTQKGHSGRPSVARSQKSQTNWLKENTCHPLQRGSGEFTQALLRLLPAQ